MLVINLVYNFIFLTQKKTIDYLLNISMERKVFNKYTTEGNCMDTLYV